MKTKHIGILRRFLASHGADEKEWDALEWIEANETADDLRDALAVELDYIGDLRGSSEYAMKPNFTNYNQSVVKQSLTAGANDKSTIKQSLTVETAEQLRKLQRVGLHPEYYDTLDKAIDGCIKIIESLRADLADPPHHVQCRVLRKLGIDGYTEDGESKLKLVNIGQTADDLRDALAVEFFGYKGCGICEFSILARHGITTERAERVKREGGQK